MKPKVNVGMRLAVWLTLFALMMTACGGPAATQAPATEAPQETVNITLQLQWFAQSQFAGYFAALDKGYYTEEGLNVTIKEGAVEIVPQQVLASGQAEFALAWVPKALVTREEGAKIVNIAQVFQRSGTLEVSWADSGITKPEDWKGKKVGTWGFGNEHELFAALRAAGLDPNNKADVEIVQQPFDMLLLINGEVDAAQAMTYNEYAQVLETVDDKGSFKYKPEDLNVINFNEVGTAMLQDHIFARESWLKKAGNEDVAVKFIRASLKGWIFCRDNFTECVDIVLKNGPTLGKGHMAWQLNEINKLIWPSPEGVGMMDKKLWDQTVKVSLDGKVITKEPTEGAVRTDLAMKALEGLKDVDTTGKDWKAETVEITAKGE
jgi:NitT/TauT family transport system substrate-binding protein